MLSLRFFNQQTLPSKQTKVPWETVVETVNVEEHAVDPTLLRIPPVEKKSRPTLRSVLTRPVLRLFASNLFMCLSSELIIGVIPLFAFTPIESGAYKDFFIFVGLSLTSYIVKQVDSPRPKHRSEATSPYEPSPKLVPWLSTSMLRPPS